MKLRLELPQPPDPALTQSDLGLDGGSLETREKLLRTLILFSYGICDAISEVTCHVVIGPRKT